MKIAVAAALVLLVPSTASAVSKPAKYPVVCNTDKVGDARYPGGDIISSRVEIKGNGLVFTWTTSKAPFLQTGEEIIYSAEFTNDKPYLRGTLYVDVLNDSDGKPTQSVEIDTPNDKTIPADAVALTKGKAFSISVSADRIWGFTGDVKTAKLTSGPLTTGAWRMTVNYGTIDGDSLGTDDSCGRNDSDQLS